MSFFQPGLFEQSTKVRIILSAEHELVRLTDVINWTALITIAATIRDSKVKKAVGPQPHYRALLGAMALMATRRMTYRDAEDQIAHYAPARYLCELMDSDMRLDHVTIFDFATMLGPAGVEQINAEVLKQALGHGVLDPTRLMSDTTAQEAMIPYPTEAGLMNRFMQLAKRAVDRLGGKFQGMKGKLKENVSKVKGLVRNSHLFAKGKEQKGKIERKIFHTVKALHAEISALLETGYNLSSKAGKELTELTAVMEKLLPQIWYFLTTGFVAKKKIIHLQMSDLYSIVRGKAGRKVEFGIKWGINRIGRGFMLGFLLDGGAHAADQRFCIEAIKVHQAIFGAAPEVFGYDRGGYSKANIKKAKKLGVKHVGIAPAGKAAWAVPANVANQIKPERAQVEGCIGTVKQRRYGFNKPQAHSTAAMARCGHSAILGFNLRKLVREYSAAEMAAAKA